METLVLKTSFISTSNLRKRFSDISATFFVANPWVGVGLLTLLAVVDWRAALLGGLASAITHWFGSAFAPNVQLLESGLLGLNGFFVGIACDYFFNVQVAFAAAFAGSLIAAVSTIALHRLLAVWQLPILVLPFVATSWLLYGIGFHQFHWQRAASPVHINFAALETFGSIGVLLSGAFIGLGQILFQPNAWVGILVLGVIASANWRLALLAFAGSFAGSAIALALNAPTLSIESGFFGFGPAMATIGAFSAVRALENQLTLKWTIVATACGLGALLDHGLAPILGALALPGLSLPYILAVWVTQLTQPVAATPWQTMPLWRNNTSRHVS
jgi:urea transporter